MIRASNQAVTFNENIAPGTAIASFNDANTGTDFDIDGDAVTYSITSGNDDSIFVIDSSTGAVTLSTSENT